MGSLTHLFRVMEIPGSRDSEPQLEPREGGLLSQIVSHSSPGSLSGSKNCGDEDIFLSRVQRGDDFMRSRSGTTATSAMEIVSDAKDGSAGA